MDEKVKKIGDKRFLIKSDSDKEKSYEVDTAMPFCDCQGFYYNKKPCKHIKLAKEAEAKYSEKPNQ
jgi:hypothetical protein